MTNFKFIALFITILSTVIFSPTTNAAAVDIGQDNPFTDGLGDGKLNDSEKQSLLVYVDSVKNRLSDALEQTKGLGFERAQQIYIAAIESSVIESYSDKKRGQLIMRYALNQALELTIGVPGADGKTIIKPGTLADSSNSELTTVILEDSIRLALNYYQDDLNAVQNANLVDLPLAAFATERLVTARSWLASVFENTKSVEFGERVLNQWAFVMKSENNVQKALYLDAILKADTALDQLHDPKNTDNNAKARFVRGTMKWLESKLIADLNSAKSASVARIEAAQKAIGYREAVANMLPTASIDFKEKYRRATVKKDDVIFRRLVIPGQEIYQTAIVKSVFEDGTLEVYKDYYMLCFGRSERVNSGCPPSSTYSEFSRISEIATPVLKGAITQFEVDDLARADLPGGGSKSGVIIGVFSNGMVAIRVGQFEGVIADLSQVSKAK